MYQLFFKTEQKIYTFYYLILIILLLGSSLTSLYWGGSLKIALYPLPFLVGLYFAMALGLKEYDDIASLFTILSVMMLIGAYIGFIYALIGGKPIWAIKNPDNRDSWLYLTTFTNARIGNIIRPSGLFDEPGAFSFFICITAILRNITKRSLKVTIAILIFGFITLSLAHFIFFIFYILSISIKKKSQLRFIFAIFIASAAFFSFTKIGNIIFSNVYNRIKINLDINNSNKDIRFLQLQNAYEAISKGNISNILFSIDPYFMDKDHFIPRESYPRMGENVLSPLAYYGIVISWVYYCYLIYLIYIGFKKKEHSIYLGLAALLMQRPNITTIGYSAIIILPIFMKMKLRSQNSKYENILHSKIA
jgi:hypothetical protein